MMVQTHGTTKVCNPMPFHLPVLARAKGPVLWWLAHGGGPFIWHGLETERTKTTEKKFEVAKSSDSLAFTWPRGQRDAYEEL